MTDRSDAKMSAWIDVDGTLVGGHPALRIYVCLPRWVGFWQARRKGVIA